tara:strand:+ start:55 stop:627 length:573 start_codon:yes stop_codon:yes gene_type:complete
LKNIIFFGPPGAGKGTQAKLISNKLNIPHYSTGDILRSKIQEKDSLAIKLKEIMSSGKLVSDEILNSIVASRLINSFDDGFILDGYPRTLTQSVYLNNFLLNHSKKIDFIFNIEISFSFLKERILKRSIEDGRDDDKIEILETRYSEYLSSTSKVSKSYKALNPQIFIELDGTLEIDTITEKILGIIKKS